MATVEMSSMREIYLVKGFYHSQKGDKGRHFDSQYPGFGEYQLRNTLH